MEKLNGYKTYIGLIVALAGALGAGKYIASEDLAIILNTALELGGLILAAYGRHVAQPKN